uniref:Sulfotransferase domain-containing protein n=1 Tax=Biomphalaria glabrata TaxID=6526 RepID=A0A2C9M5Z2_BIOGL
MATIDKEAETGLASLIRKESCPEAYGWRVVGPTNLSDPLQHVENIRGFKIRDDDVILAAYPKCGTHWVWEITHMLLRQTTDYEKRCKEQVMLESNGGIARCEKEESPRIINSHFVFAHLPQEIIAKKSKIIHVWRNPKDTLVSFYYHYKSVIVDSRFTFSDVLETSMADKFTIHTQFEYLQQMSKFEEDHPDHPIIHLCYEEMKKEPIKVIQELARFLKVPTDDEFCRKVADACSFENMKVINQSGQKMFPAEFSVSRGPGHKNPEIYRKGVVGDWKNHFTVSENERYNDVINRAGEKGLKFKFIYQ